MLLTLNIDFLSVLLYNYNIKQILIPILLAWHHIITFNSFSSIIPVIGIIFTMISNVLACENFKRSGVIMAVIVTVGQGVCGVTIQTVNNYDHVVSIEV